MTSSDAVKIATYLSLSVTTGVVPARFILTRIWKRKIGRDDCLLFLAFLLTIGQSVLTQQAAEANSTPYIRAGNFAVLGKIFKLHYASDLLYLIVLAVSRASAICLLHRMVPPRCLTRRMSPIMHSINLVWAIFSVFGIAFQCSIRMPWIYLPSRCAASGVMWYPVLILNVLIDVFLSTAIFPELPNLLFKPTQKKIIASTFAFRSVVCATGVVHLALLSPALRSENQPREMLTPNILKQVVLNLSVIAAAIPALYKPASTTQHAEPAMVEVKELDTPLDSPTSSTRRKGFFSFYKQQFARSNKSDKPSTQSEKSRVISFVPMSNLPVLKLPFGDEHNSMSKFGLGPFLKSDHKRAGSSQDLMISESIAWYVNSDLETERQKRVTIQLPKPEPAHRK